MVTVAPMSIDEILERARARLTRLDPHEVASAVDRGAILVDIRPAAQRAEFGEIPGAVIIERNVLEWRLDPASDHRIPEVTGHHQPVVLVCNEGYASSLAAATLADLGFTFTADVIGGFQAWRSDGLPTERAKSI
jgi:rhodanese-related sulfurtransferase